MSTTNNTRLVAFANTSHGFAIGIIETRNTHAKRYSVVRMNRQSKYVTLSYHRTEAEARTAANAEFKADRQACAA